MAATAASVSRALGKAGVQRARWIKSHRVKGWGNWAAGAEIKAEKRQDGTAAVTHYDRFGHAYTLQEPLWRTTGRVFVTWEPGSWATAADLTREARLANPQRCLEALGAAGYTVELDEESLRVVARRGEA